MSPLPPLSHHELLVLAGPFARRGRQADLHASDRAARRLAFRPRALPAADGLPALTETLLLENPDGGPWRLLRTLTPPGGIAATLTAEAEDPAALLEQVDAVPPASQFRRSGDAEVALHHRLARNGLRLSRAEARVAGLTLAMSVSGVSGFPAELEVLRSEGDTIQLPRDLLAVLGRRWDRLTPLQRGWLGSVQIKGDGPLRSTEAEAAFLQAVDHLQHTLAGTPLAFHQRHLRARWRVAMRGTLPLLVGVGIVALAFALRGHGSSRAASALALLANVAPPLLMGLFFMRREMPQIGLPRFPRRPGQEAWR